jgi:hypothetical protein
VHGKVGRSAGGILLLTLLGGCASTKRLPPPRTVSEPCEGEAILIIENDAGFDLDVLEARSGRGGRTVIATVGPGYHEILVRREGGYYYFTSRVQTGNTVVSESMRASARDRVRLRRECRSPESAGGP